MAQVQKVATVERKQNNNFISKTQKIELLKKLENKSTRQSETILREFSPLSAIKNDSQRVINNYQTEIKIIADQELLNKIEELKNLLSHKHVNPNFNELLHSLTDLALVEVKRRKKILSKSEEEKGLSAQSVVSKEITVKKSDKNLKTYETPDVQKQEVQKNTIQQQRAQKQSIDLLLNKKLTSAPKKLCGKLQYRNQRYIHPTVKNEVWFRDGGCCSYKDPLTNRKCESKFQLEFDHIKPVAMGGESDINNIRLLCREHNQYMAYKNNIGQLKNSFRIILD